eukprot:scaffold3551_cov408-Prasinococcus_capsulatus_cf.AAC.29
MDLLHKHILAELRTAEQTVADASKTALLSTLEKDLLGIVEAEYLIDEHLLSKSGRAPKGDGLKGEESKRRTSLFFFEVLAHRYAVDYRLDFQADILPLYKGTLRSQNLFLSVFTLLSYEWVLRPESVISAGRLEYISEPGFCLIFSNGVKALLLKDLHSDRQNFSSIFLQLLESILLPDSILEAFPSSHKKRIFKAVAISFFHYIPGTECDELLPQLTDVVGIELFIETICQFLLRGRSGNSTVKYLRSSVHIRGLALPRTSRSRLHSALYALQKRGAPLYPPKEVRAAARVTMDEIFPEGRRWRALIRCLGMSLEGSSDYVDRAYAGAA